MKTTVDLGDGIYQIKVPLPFPLLWVNAYAVKEKQAWTVIDPGLHTAHAEQRWEEAAIAIGMDWDGIESVVLTHHHPDHYGMSGWFQERTGAPVWCSAAAEEQALRLWGDRSKETAQHILDLFQKHGLPAEESQPMKEHLLGFVKWVTPRPDNIRHIEPGSPIRLGGKHYEALLTEGHATGHLSFFNKETGRIFCGDHVLPGITPNVSYLPGGDPNPLRTYLHALDKAAQLPVAEALPGHREPFRHLAERCAAIRKHHEHRLDRMAELMQQPVDAYSICRSLFGDKLSVHQLRFALSETIAHLIYMES